MVKHQRLVIDIKPLKKLIPDASIQLHNLPQDPNIMPSLGNEMSVLGKIRLIPVELEHFPHVVS